MDHILLFPISIPFFCSTSKLKSWKNCVHIVSGFIHFLFFLSKISLIKVINNCVVIFIGHILALIRSAWMLLPSWIILIFSWSHTLEFLNCIYKLFLPAACPLPPAVYAFLFSIKTIRVIWKLIIFLNCLLLDNKVYYWICKEAIQKVYRILT